MPRTSSLIPSHDCIIVGGGCSGTLTAFHLSRLSSGEGSAGRSISCAIVEPGELGPGLPYQTQHPLHVLNVPAGRMSAMGGEPDHFVKWCKGGPLPKAGGGDFVPRGVFGQYLRSLAEQSGKTLKLEHVRSRATGLSSSEGIAKILCEDGREISASHAVLAWGHGVPRVPPNVSESARAHEGYVNNPWTAAFSQARLSRGVLFVGTGLTMLDCVMMVADQAPECRMLAVSRRGLLPQPHRHHDAPPRKLPPPPIAYWPTTTRGITRAVRTYVRSCRNKEWDWREAVTALRPVTSQLWGGMAAEERRRFLDRLVPYWDSHRHRAAPQVSARIDQLQGSGVLDVLAARIERIDAVGEELKVTLRMRGGKLVRTLTFGYVVNCTGPETDVGAMRNPLISSLIEGGLLMPDELRLGLQMDEHGRPFGSGGAALENVWTIGPLRKAQLWETTAVPEIRIQAEELAKKIAASVR